MLEGSRIVRSGGLDKACDWDWMTQHVGTFEPAPSFLAYYTPEGSDLGTGSKEGRQ